MIITRLTGGLGNQMFQYAAGFALARTKGVELRIDADGYARQQERGEQVREYALNDFRTTAPLLEKFEVERYRNPFGLISRVTRQIDKRYFRAHYHDWHPEIFRRRGNIYLDGYFQSARHFAGLDAEIIREFRLTDQLQQELEPFRRILAKGGMLCVSVHVRRGDYLDANQSSTYNICTPNYFHQAVDRIGEKVSDYQLVVFSDDPEWAKANLAFKRNSIFVSDMIAELGPPLRPSQEMILMSLCDHHVISNSTFSWWGAYLNDKANKIVIAPQPWNRNPKTPHKNIIPAGWETIEVTQ